MKLCAYLGDFLYIVILSGKRRKIFGQSLGRSTRVGLGSLVGFCDLADGHQKYKYGETVRGQSQVDALSMLTAPTNYEEVAGL